MGLCQSMIMAFICLWIFAARGSFAHVAFTFNIGCVCGFMLCYLFDIFSLFLSFVCLFFAFSNRTSTGTKYIRTLFLSLMQFCCCSQNRHDTWIFKPTRTTLMRYIMSVYTQTQQKPQKSCGYNFQSSTVLKQWNVSLLFSACICCCSG